VGARDKLESVRAPRAVGRGDRAQETLPPCRRCRRVFAVQGQRCQADLRVTMEAHPLEQLRSLVQTALAAAELAEPRHGVGRLTGPQRELLTRPEQLRLRRAPIATDDQPIA
jgi:hypothetical protein